jgi:hypothetical protein
MVGAQPAGDLLRGILLRQIVLNSPAQHQVRGKLRRLGPAGAIIGECVRGRSPVIAFRVPVTRYLSTDRRRSAPKTTRDSANRFTRSPFEGNFFSLGEAQTAPFQVATSPRPNPTCLP